MKVKTLDALLFLAEGFEEIEALTPLDILRRGGCEIASVSLSGPEVTGSHGITVHADTVFADCFPSGGEPPRVRCLILPGGPGTARYKEHAALLEVLRRHHADGGFIAAICAAPAVLGFMGLLRGIEAVCFPGCEPEMTGARLSGRPVVTNQRFTTAKSAAFALPFALEALRVLKGADAERRVRQQIHM